MEFLTGCGLALALAGSIVVFGAVATSASGDGLTAAQLQAQAWTCVLVPVENLLHCRNPGSEPLVAGPTQLDFLVFDASGATFLGTEHLIRSDLYHGQPCNGTPTGLYEFMTRAHLAGSHMTDPDNSGGRMFDVASFSTATLQVGPTIETPPSYERSR